MYVLMDERRCIDCGKGLIQFWAMNIITPYPNRLIVAYNMLFHNAKYDILVSLLTLPPTFT